MPASHIHHRKTHGSAHTDQSGKPLVLYRTITLFSSCKSNCEMNNQLARRSRQENTINYDALSNSILSAGGGVITAEWCFPDPVSGRRNTGIMDLISSVKILARFCTRQAKSMLRTAPCVFSCHIETTMTPIMPMKSWLSAVVVSL